MRNLHAVVSTVLRAWIAAGSVERACTSPCLCLECVLGCMYVCMYIGGAEEGHFRITALSHGWTEVGSKI